MVDWNALNDEEKAAAEKAFGALITLDDLRRRRIARGEQNAALDMRPVGFSDLYAYAMGRGGIGERDIKQAMLRNPALRGQLGSLLRRVSIYRAPQVAAASSGEIDRREGEGFVIRLKVSRADPEQTYVIIELAHPEGRVPHHLFLFGEHETSRFDLPEVQEGIMQILAASTSPLVSGLKDIKREVFLR